MNFEIERKTNWTLANALRPKRIGKFFEHFIVVGNYFPDIEEFENKNLHLAYLKPEILFQFPIEENKPLDTQNVAQFCFPQKSLAKIVKRTPCLSGRNEILFGQLSKAEETHNSYVILVTGGDQLLYGICVSQLELIDKLPNFVKQPKDTQIRPSSSSDYFAPRVYCLLTRFPFFRLHFGVLYSLLARERLTSIEKELHVNTAPGEIPFEENQLEIIKGFYEKNVPQETSSISFYLPGELRAFEFTCPPGDEDKLIAEWGISALFRLLSLENILTIFEALMLEKQLIITCSNPGLLSAITLSFLPIFRPYVFQGPFIPILPTHLHDYLEAPVPFVIGLTSLESIPLERMEKDKVIIYVEKDVVSIPKQENWPELPDKKKLRNGLKQYHKELQSRTSAINTYHISPEDAMIIPQILVVFKSYQSWLMDDVIIKNLHLENGYVDFSNRQKIEELLHNNQTKTYKHFLEVFLCSQHFSIYSDKLKEIISIQRNSPKMSKPPVGILTKAQSLSDFSRFIPLKKSKSFDYV